MRKPVGVAISVTVPEKPLRLVRVIVEAATANGSLIPFDLMIRKIGLAVI